ncbi:N-6 DNA methylase [Oceanithermus sp.]|uniref:N-6 DNA methylase n=1 Tax=Oceanithermus sp. TaxID=2268145 RepID=UPI00257B5EB6|nr:N-6 DNA methylase [Oceanithermus sp.]
MKRNMQTGPELQISRIVPEGKIQCYITGELRKDTPEERVRQEWARKLVEEYGYPKRNIGVEVTVPMGRARKRADLVIYEDGKPQEIEHIRIIVEAKQEKIKPQDKKKGIEQLKSYLSACPNAEWGLWVGSERQAFQRVTKRGRHEFLPTTDIPRYGERAPRRLTFKDLKPAEGLKRELRRVHNYIYANQGLPKDQAFHELLKLVFCKVYEERNKRASDPLDFDIAPDERFTEEGKKALRKRLERLFEGVKTQYPYIFEKDDHLRLNDDVLAYVVSELRQYSFLHTRTDIKGAAYQEVVRDNLRGDRGEFFTPDNVCRMAVQMGVETLAKESRGKKTWTNIRVLDPAVGAGGFLRAFMNELRAYLAMREEGKHSNPEALTQAVMNELRDICNRNIYGLDINPLLVRAAQMNLVMHGDGSTNVYHVEGGSLIPFEHMPKEVQERLTPGSVDLIVTNPPFGSGPGLKVDNPNILAQYELTTYGLHKGRSRSSLPPEQLFIERAYHWLSPGGVLAIVLPDSILSNPGLRYIRDWILDRFIVVASVDLPIETFVAFGGTGTQTSVLVLRKKTIAEIEREKLAGKPQEYEVFMAVPHTMGYDRRGNDLWRRDKEGRLIIGARDDEVSEVAELFMRWLEGEVESQAEGA